MTVSGVILSVVTWLLIILGGVLALAVAVIFLIALALTVVLVLQAVGVLRRVPFSYNARNLLVRWRVTLMTALAFVLVVGLMTVMLAFVNGMFELTRGSAHPGNVIVLADGATDELFSNLGYGDVENLPTEIPGVLKGPDAEGKEQYLASWETYMVVNQKIPQKCPVCGRRVELDDTTRRLVPHGDPPCPGSDLDFKGGRQRRFVQVRGIVDPVIAGRVHGLDLQPGGAWFDPKAGAQSLPADKGGGEADQCVLGEGLARELGKDADKPGLEVGDAFTLGPRRWVVVGVLKSSGSTFDSELWAKQSLAGELFGKSSYTTAVLRTADADAAKSVAEKATKDFKSPAVSAVPESEYYEKLNATNYQFLGAIIFVAAVMAVGGVFGVMNTMFAAISQRIKDIGVLRILGYSSWQVLASFFLESLLLAAVGGVLGIAVGSLCHGWSANSIASSGVGGGKSVALHLTISWWILASGFAFSLLMGAVGGLVPALSAMQKKPLESLR